MALLDGRTYAIAGVGGGLGPLVAARLAADGASVAGTDRDQGTARRARRASSGSRLSAGTAAPSTCSTRRRCGGGARRWSSASAGSTGSIHLVGGWRGGQPLHEAPLADWDLLHDLLVRTVQHTTRAFHDQLAASRARALRPRLRQAGAGAEQHERRLRRGQGGRRGLDAGLADGFEPGGATANIVVVEAILTPQMREENPGRSSRPSPRPSTSPPAIAFLCSDARGGDERPAPAAYDGPMSKQSKKASRGSGRQDDDRRAGAAHRDDDPQHPRPPDARPAAAAGGARAAPATTTRRTSPGSS